MRFIVYATGHDLTDYLPILKKYNMTNFKKGEYAFDHDTCDIEISSLGQLREFQEEVDKELVIYSNSIEIYDDWRE